MKPNKTLMVLVIQAALLCAAAPAQEPAAVNPTQEPGAAMPAGTPAQEPAAAMPAGTPAQGPAVTGLDLKSAVALALENNLTVKNNRIDLKNSELSLANIWNQFMPGVNLSGSVGQRQGGANQNPSTANSLGFGVSASLTLKAAMIYNARQYVLDYQSGKISLAKARTELSYTVKKTYYNLVLLQEQLALMDKQIQKAKSDYELTLSKYNKGMVSEIDKLKSQYAYMSLVPDYSSMQNQYTSLLMGFRQMLGLKDGTEIRLTDQIPEIMNIDYEKLAHLSVTNNPDILLLMQNLKSDENAVALRQASLIPSVSLSYSLSTSFAEDFTRADLFDGDNWIGAGSLNLSVSVPLDPFFPYSATQVQIETDRNNVEIRRNEIQDQIEQKQLSMVTDILKLKQIEGYIDTLKINAQIAEQTLHLVDLSYNAGLKSFLDLQDAENNLFDAQLKLLDARYQYVTTYLDLKYILNVEDQ
jgi:outer membrane protein TolC